MARRGFNVEKAFASWSDRGFEPWEISRIMDDIMLETFKRFPRTYGAALRLRDLCDKITERRMIKDYGE